MLLNSNSVVDIFPINFFGMRTPLTTLISQCQNIIHHYHQLKTTSSPINPNLIPLIFKSLASSQSIKHGISVHADAIKMGFDSHTSTCNSILSFYCKCGMSGSALNMFDEMPHRDPVSWNALIHGFLSRDDFELGLSLFEEARISDFTPNISSLILALQACWRLEANDKGRNIHAFITKSGVLAVVFVQNALLNMYVKIQDLDSAHTLFDAMCDRDVISWSALISGYAQCDAPKKALQLFRLMYTASGVKIDGLTVVSVLKACTSARDIGNARLVHGHLIHGGFESDVFVGNSLLDVYSKCLDVDSALRVFADMPLTNIVTWNSIISGLVHNEKYFEALVLFESMKKCGIEGDEFTTVNLLQACKKLDLAKCCKSIHAMATRRWLLNDFVSNSLIDAYAKCELIELALKMFNQTERLDIISWSTMVSGYARCGKPDEAVSFFKEMQLANVTPNSITILSLLEACAISAELMLSKSTHCLVVRKYLADDLAVGTALIDMYAKCGDLNSSRKVFDELPNRSILSWNAMIGALGINGCAKEALALLHAMESEKVKPNGVTMLSVLSACSHGGLIQDGLSCFERMLREATLKPHLEHYSCVVDMLGRAGDLNGALKVIERLPKEFEAGPATWGALLSACRNHGNLEIGKFAASLVIKLEPENSAGYLLSSGMFAKSELAYSTARMRCLIKEKKLKMVSGYSLVHVKQRAHKFVAWDESHPLSREIYNMVDYLHDCIKQTRKKLILCI